MVDLNTEAEEPKKLVFESPKAEQDTAVKIADSPHKRWKTFGIIGGVLTLVIAISIASNWGAISQNFTGSFVGIGQDNKIITPEILTVQNLPNVNDLKLVDNTTFEPVNGFCADGYALNRNNKCVKSSVTLDGTNTSDLSTKTGGSTTSTNQVDLKYVDNGDIGKPVITSNSNLNTVGQDLIDKVVQATQKTCPEGQTLKPDGACVIEVIPVEKTCPTGTTLNTSGTCVSNAITPIIQKCPAGTVMQPNGQCGKDKLSVLTICPPDSTLNTAGVCVADPLASTDITCPRGTQKVVSSKIGTQYECVAIAETTPSCDAGKTYDATLKTCVENSSRVCTDIESRVSKYKTELLQENTQNKSAIEVELLEYLFTKAVQSGLSKSCNISDDYKNAAKCTAKESFDKKTGACKSAPGYKKAGNNSDEFDCTELESAIAAIDVKLLESATTTEEKSYLSNLKLDLATGKTFCANKPSTSGGGGSSSSSSGGGGGGTPKSSSTAKDFEIKNVVVNHDEFNPFQEKSVVYFFITYDAYVSMQVLDGNQLVQTIKEAKMNAGDRSMSWDGKRSQGGFVPEGDYTLRIIAKKATNKANQIEEDVTVTVKYFDPNTDLPVDPTFEGESGAVVFTGTGSGSGSGTSNGSGTFGNGSSEGHGTSGPLAQNIYGQSNGKANTSKTGPETALYLLLILASSAIVFVRPVKKHRK